MVDVSQYLHIAEIVACKFTRYRPIRDTEEFADACVALLKAQNKYEPEKGEFGGYAYRSCINELVYKQRKSRQWMDRHKTPSRGWPEILQNLKTRMGSNGSHEPTLTLDTIAEVRAEKEPVDYDRLEKAERILQEILNPEEVKILKERWDGKTIKEIAADRGCSSPVMKQRLFRVYYKLNKDGLS